MSVVNNLKETRKSRGVDQKALSVAIGFSTRTISRIERGVQPPSAEFMLRVSKYFSLLVEDIFEFTE